MIDIVTKLGAVTFEMLPMDEREGTLKESPSQYPGSTLYNSTGYEKGTRLMVSPARYREIMEESLLIRVQEGSTRTLNE